MHIFELATREEGQLNHQTAGSITKDVRLYSDFALLQYYAVFFQTEQVH